MLKAAIDAGNAVEVRRFKMQLPWLDHESIPGPKHVLVSPLYYAAHCGLSDEPALKELLRRTSDCNISGHEKITGSPLLRAAATQNTSMVRALVEFDKY